MSLYRPIAGALLLGFAFAVLAALGHLADRRAAFANKAVSIDGLRNGDLFLADARAIHARAGEGLIDYRSFKYGLSGSFAQSVLGTIGSTTAEAHLRAMLAPSDHAPMPSAAFAGLVRDLGLADDRGKYAAFLAGFDATYGPPAELAHGVVIMRAMYQGLEAAAGDRERFLGLLAKHYPAPNLTPAAGAPPVRHYPDKSGDPDRDRKIDQTKAIDEAIRQGKRAVVNERGEVLVSPTLSERCVSLRRELRARSTPEADVQARLAECAKQDR